MKFMTMLGLFVWWHSFVHLFLSSARAKQPVHSFLGGKGLGIWANQPIHAFLVGCLNPCLQGMSVHVVSPQPWFRHPTRNECVGWFTQIFLASCILATVVEWHRLFEFAQAFWGCHALFENSPDAICQSCVPCFLTTLHDHNFCWENVELINFAEFQILEDHKRIISHFSFHFYLSTYSLRLPTRNPYR